MKRLCLVSLFLLLGSVSGSAQTLSTKYQCEVSMMDFNTDNETILGDFTAVVTGEKLLNKTYRFPDTELFVSASFGYLKQSRILGGPPGNEIVLTLALAKKAYTSIESEMKANDVVSNARAVFPANSFRTAELETIYLARPQPVIIALKCKN